MAITPAHQTGSTLLLALLWPTYQIITAGALLLILALLIATRHRWRSWIQRRPGMAFLLVIALGALALFGQLSDSVLDHAQLVRLDTQLVDGMHRSVAPGVQPLLLAISELGASGLIVLAIATAAFLLWRRRRADLLLWCVALGGGNALNIALKLLIQRPRPPFAAALGETDWSFPSNHAMSSLIVYGLLAWLLGRHLSPRWRPLLAGATALLVLAIGLSRVYLGVHYLSDVIAGYAAGALWMALCLLVYLALQPPAAPAPMPPDPAGRPSLP